MHSKRSRNLSKISRKLHAYLRYYATRRTTRLGNRSSVCFYLTTYRVWEQRNEGLSKAGLG